MAPDGAAWEAWEAGREAGFINLIALISLISLISLMRPLGERRLCAAWESMLACPGRGAVGFGLGGQPSGSRGWSGAVRRGCWALCAGGGLCCREAAGGIDDV